MIEESLPRGQACAPAEICVADVYRRRLVEILYCIRSTIIIAILIAVGAR